MTQHSAERKAVTLLAAVILFCLTLWLARGAVVISGTKSTFTAVDTKSAPIGATATATATTTTTSTSAAKTTSPANQP